MIPIVKAKTVSQPSYLYNWNPIHGKTVFILKWTIVSFEPVKIWASCFMHRASQKIYIWLHCVLICRDYMICSSMIQAIHLFMCFGVDSPPLGRSYLWWLAQCQSDATPKDMGKPWQFQTTKVRSLYLPLWKFCFDVTPIVVLVSFMH